MIWEESLWVKNRGMDYGSKFDDEYGYDIIDGHHKGCASYGFPVSNTDNYDGEDFRNACIHLFKNLEKQMKKNNETTSGSLFKIIVEHIGNNVNGDDEYWVYLLYT